MKSSKLFLTIMAACLVMTSCAKHKNVQITRNYDVQAFQAIDLDGVANIIYTQGDSFAVRAEGDSVQITRTDIKVEDGCLKIRQQNGKGDKQQVDIYITTPTLVKVEMDGVGSFKSQKPVTFANDLKFEAEGVGAVEISDLTCKTLNFEQEGVGSSKLKVKCETALFHCEGVGSCNLNIEADTLKIKNEGVGSFKVKGHVKNYKHHSGGVTSKISDKDLQVDER